MASPLLAAREFAVSRNTSPPSGYRLDNPARTAGATGAAGSVAPRRQDAAAPSWRKVILTTLHLWVRRHVLHVPDTGRIGRARAAGITAVIVITVVVIAVAAAVALTGAPASHRAGQHQVTPPALTPAQKQAQAAARQAAANGTAAAAWIAAEVSRQTVIGCDPATCAAILSAGYPSGSQVVLEPGVSLPAAGALVVATPAVRAQYGTQLEAAAAPVIASFGTGSQAVQVRLVVPGGQAAYSQIGRAHV